MDDVNPVPHNPSSTQPAMLIVGGTGEMGQWFTRFFGDRGYRVSVWGFSKRIDVAKRMGVEFAHDLEQAVGQADIVVISVTIDQTVEMIKRIALHMKTGSLLMDLTSIKEAPLAAMNEYAPKGVEVIGTHPMFGPSIPDIRGQTVILTPPDKQCTRWYPVIHDVFDKAGAHIEVISAKEHDRIMAVVQGLTHFAYIAIGSTFKELEFDVAKSRRFMSPVYEIMVDFVGRILGQNPYLYAMIQVNNRDVEHVHKTFIQECEKISAVVKGDDISAFVDLMKDAATHFGNTESALRRSDKLINNKISEFEKLASLIGSTAGFVHLYTGMVHIGVLKKLSPVDIVLGNGKKDVSLKLENIKLMTDAELRQWKAENIALRMRDVSAFIPNGAKPEVICSVIECVDDVVSVELLDVYERDGDTSITVRLGIMGDADVEIVMVSVWAMLEGVGCKVRV